MFSMIESRVLFEVLTSFSLVATCHSGEDVKICKKIVLLA